MRHNFAMETMQSTASYLCFAHARHWQVQNTAAGSFAMALWAVIVGGVIVARILWLLLRGSERLGFRGTKPPTGSVVGTVASLYTHPVKSGRAVEVAQCQLDELGLCGDRRLVVVRVPTKGSSSAPLVKALNQKRRPQLATIAATPIGPQQPPSQQHGGLPQSVRLVSAAQGATAAPKPLKVDVWAALAECASGKRPRVPVKVVTSNLEAVDLGDEAGEWLDAALAAAALEHNGRRAAVPRGHRLYAVLPDCARFSRDVPLVGMHAAPGHRVAGADVAPLLVVSSESLASLSSAMPSGTAQVQSFRPNVVVDGMPAWLEDEVETLRVGDVELRRVGPCPRCTLTTVDQVA